MVASSVADTLRALVVEGRAEHSTALTDVLKNCGYAVVGAADLASLRKVANENFDVILCSEVVEGASAPETLQLIAQLKPGVPVVFVAAQPDSPALAQAREFGVTETFIQGDFTALYPKLAALQEKSKRHQSRTTVHPVKLSDLEPSGQSSERANVDLIMDVPVVVKAVLGSATLPIADLLQLGAGSVVELNKRAGEPVELYINDKLIATGEVVIVDDSFGIRIVEVCDHRQRVQALA